LAVPEDLSLRSPAVLLVGMRCGLYGASVAEQPDGLFSALLDLAQGDHDVVVVDVDAVDQDQAEAFARALRSHTSTRELALLVVSRWSDRRQALAAAGADLCITSNLELATAVSFVTGASARPVTSLEEHGRSRATAALRPERDSDEYGPSVAGVDPTALAG
jgi:DNA-binding NarL/FixJ family response regulator